MQSTTELIEPGEPDGPPAGDGDVASPGGPSDVGMAAVLAALLLAFAPFVVFPSWTPRAAVLLAVFLPGVVALLASVRRDVPARLALGFVAVVWLTALLADSPRMSAIGGVGRDLSAVTVTASFGVWALARRVSPQGRDRCVAVVVGAGAVNAVVGAAQVAFGIDAGALALLDGRPAGLLVNPVYFGAACAGSVVLGASRVSSGPWWVAATVVTGAGCALSGSRVAVAAAVLVLGWIVARSRTRAAVLGAVTSAAGLALGAGIDLLAGNDLSATRRLTSGEGGGRLSAWRYGIEAFAERPVVGHGIGRFRSAVQGRFEPAFVRDYAADDVTQPWFDAHNIVIGVIVGVGLPGLVLLGVWLWRCCRVASGPPAAAAAVIGITWMLQPPSLHTLPLALALLGLAMPIRPDGGCHTGRTRTVLLTAGALSTGLGVLLAVGDLRLDRATDAVDASAAAAAAGMFGDDPVVADVVAQVALADTGLDDATAWWVRATEWESDRPLWWTRLARAQLEANDLDGAERSVAAALALQPTNLTANVLAVDVAARRGDIDAVSARLDDLCELDEHACTLEAEDVVG